MTHFAAHQPRQTRFWALVPCAGSGSRAGTAQPKQYKTIAGKPMVLHTLAAFAAVKELSGVLVVVAAGDRFLNSAALPGALYFIADCGGSTRAKSVLNGLNALLAQGAAADDWVLVHDAARCLVTPDQITKLITACQDDAVGGLLALPLPDTLKSEMGGRVDSTIDRNAKWLAQTPQMFRLGPLREALARTGVQVTDESSAMEALGLHPLLVAGSAQNFKVTFPEDFALAQHILLVRQNSIRLMEQAGQPSSLEPYDYP
jgi:2-C-methyl-D-erythritol 4-phosphate cytidylyltransferase